MKKINTMKIEGKRWFQRTYGNTYHTVKVFVNGEILKSEITYGYGSHYLQTAAELLKKTDTISKKITERLMLISQNSRILLKM